MFGTKTVGKLLLECGLRAGELPMRHNPEAKRIINLLRERDVTKRNEGLEALDNAELPLGRFLPRLVTMITGSDSGRYLTNDDKELVTKIIAKSDLDGLRMLLRQLSPGKSAEGAHDVYRALFSILNDENVIKRLGPQGIDNLIAQADRYHVAFGSLARPYFESAASENKRRVANILSTTRQVLAGCRQFLESVEALA
jgi:hypothetical protein